MDELNEYLECTCGRCDDGICRCSECEHEHPQEIIYNNDFDYVYEEDVEENKDWV